MKHASPVYVCTNCDAQSPKWTGQCMECGKWSTMVAAADAPRAATAGGASARAASSKNARPAKTLAFESLASESEKRVPTGIAEADRVLGGGIVPGSVTLLGGEPGIGKSTLAMMLASRLAGGAARGAAPGGSTRGAAARTTLYVSGEESASQVKMRADRLGVGQAGMHFLNETDVDVLIATMEHEKPALAVIDSIQMLRCEDVPAEAGAVGQVRQAAARLVAFAKSSNVPVLLIGHVTKDGIVAGPKTLEHLVDTVLSFEGDSGHPIRTLRAIKNRFGSTDETGIFEMNDAGLAEIRNPSAYLLDARQEGIPGSAVCCVLEGTRPILVEVQALVQRTAFGYPARKSSGIDQARIDMLLAVLGKRASLDFSSHDVYINVVGGVKVKEPAADLAVALALASALKHSPLPKGTVAWGEVGLGGELRPAPGHDRRVAEAAALGMSRAIAPAPRAATGGTPRKAAPTGIRQENARQLRDAVAAAFAGVTSAPSVTPAKAPAPVKIAVGK